MTGRDNETGDAAGRSPGRGTWRSRNVVHLGLVSFFTDIHSETVLALLPQFMANTLGLPRHVIGLIEGLADAAASGLKIGSGWFSDRIGRRKPVLLAGYALSTVVKPLLALAQVGWHVLGVRVGDRIGKGVRTSARDALLAESVTPTQRGRAFGLHRAMDTAGAIVGTALAILLLNTLSGGIDDRYRQAFLIATAAGVLAVLTIVLGVRETPRARGERAPARPPAEFPGSLPLFLVAHTAFSAGNFSYAFFLLRAQDVGVRAELVPLLYLLHNLVYAAAAFPAGALLDSIGVRRTQVGAYLVHAVVCVGFALHATAGAMPLWFALYGVAMGAVGACTRATVSGLVCADRRGLGMGVFHACEGAGLLVASVTGGLLWEWYARGAAPFWYGAALAALATLLAWAALRPRAT